jgi:hypothetical protein
MAHSDSEKAILLALEALLKGKRDNGAKAAREAVLDALEKGGYRWPRADDGRF